MESSELRRPRRRVFVCYAREDRRVALQVARSLERGGVPVWFPEDDVEADKPWWGKLESEIESSDVVLVLCSEASVFSPWMNDEFHTAVRTTFRQRLITVLPVQLDDEGVPPFLADREEVDMRRDFDAGMDRILSRLHYLEAIEFDELDAIDFEELVRHVLGSVGLSVRSANELPDSSVDGIVTSDDDFWSFPGMEPGTWLLEVKHRGSHVGVETLRQLLGSLVLAKGRIDDLTGGLLVTSSTLTSVALETALELQHEKPFAVRVIERDELIQMLIEHPEIIEKYFARRLDGGF